MIKCITVDDEPLALTLLDDYIAKVPFLELSKACKSSFDALQVLQNESIDLMFLDVKMPDVSGIQFLKTIRQRPMVVLTTAYDEYALEGYDLDLIDFLLKPIPFERFLKAVNKVFELHQLKHKPNTNLEGFQQPAFEKIDHLFVKEGYKTIRLPLNEILYIEGFKDYIKIYTETMKPVLTLLNLKWIIEKLPVNDFVRIHRSYIVSISKIELIERNRVRIKGKDLPIGDFYRDGFNAAVSVER
ncbi:MAG: LytTR family DNA-binding domain-containing protein [Chitinophagales bacterium]|nr:LytTR family DNA-binding domain-containing protein [Chitinophagales bacterium]